MTVCISDYNNIYAKRNKQRYDMHINDNTDLIGKAIGSNKQKDINEPRISDTAGGAASGARARRPWRADQPRRRAEWARRSGSAERTRRSGSAERARRSRSAERARRSGSAKWAWRAGRARGAGRPGARTARTGRCAPPLFLAPLRSHLLLADHPVERLERVVVAPTTIHHNYTICFLLQFTHSAGASGRTPNHAFLYLALVHCQNMTFQAQNTNLRGLV